MVRYCVGDKYGPVGQESTSVGQESTSVVQGPLYYSGGTVVVGTYSQGQ